MMTTIFYFLVVICLVFEIVCLFGAKRVHAGVKKYRGVTELDKMSSLCATFILFHWFYTLLCFVGLMSSQWVCFLALIALSFIPKYRWYAWRITDGILSIAILVFIILNKYHFHIQFIIN